MTINVEIEKDDIVISRKEYFALKDEVKRLKKLVKLIIKTNGLCPLCKGYKDHSPNCACKDV